MQNTADDPSSGPQVLSVSDLNRQARITIEERFHEIWVTGEISNFVRPRSGHWYFSLKDDRAQVRCAMFANRNRAAKVQPGDGQMVVLRGRVSLYEGRGDFQIIVDQIEPAGAGALQQAFEALKRKLAGEGLFAGERKRPLPTWPTHIAVVTSATGAALRDVLAVWQRRYPALRVTVVPSLVQGEAAQAALIDAISRAQSVSADALLLTRGGGSLEDLWAFNLEPVARALAASNIPTVCAVGHEIDTTICDYVADVRAPTPSAAAEMLVPERDEVLARVHNQARRLLRATENQLTIRRLQLRGAQAALISPQATLEQAHLRLEDKSSALQRTLATRLNDERAHLGYLQRHLRTLGPLQAIAGAQQRLTSGRQNLARATRDKLEERTNQLTYLRRYLHGHNPSNRIRGAGTQLEQLYRGLVRAMQQRVTQARTDLGSTARILHNLSPLPTLERGYAIARDRDGAIINNAANVNVGDDVDTWLARGKISARVTAVDPDAQPGG